MERDAFGAKGFRLFAHRYVAVVVVVTDLPDDDQVHAAGELARHFRIRQRIALAAVADQDEWHLWVGLEQPADRGSLVFGAAAPHVALSRAPVGEEHRTLRERA